MSKLNSNKVFVFPCVSRTIDGGNKSLSAKLMSEKNITNIIKSVTDTSSYIISWGVNNDGNGLLTCVIDGYYFELSDITPSVSSGTNNRYKYLKLVRYTALGENDEQYMFSRIDGTDTQITGTTNYEFSGIEVNECVNESDIQTDSPVLILSVDGKICKESYIKYDTKSLNLTVIDCGDLG